MADDKLQVGTTNEYLNTNKVTTSAGDVHNEVIDHGNFISGADKNSRAAATLAAAARVGAGVNIVAVFALTGARSLLRHCPHSRHSGHWLGRR